jgi:hypothetical protein
LPEVGFDDRVSGEGSAFARLVDLGQRSVDRRLFFCVVYRQMLARSAVVGLRLTLRAGNVVLVQYAHDESLRVHHSDAVADVIGRAIPAERSRE